MLRVKHGDKHGLGHCGAAPGERRKWLGLPQDTWQTRFLGRTGVARFRWWGRKGDSRSVAGASLGAGEVFRERRGEKHGLGRCRAAPGGFSSGRISFASAETIDQTSVQSVAKNGSGSVKR